MNASSSALRIAKSEASPLPPRIGIGADGDRLADAGSLACIVPVENRMQVLQAELSLLQGELDSLRRRDESLNYYMLRMDEEMRLAARLQQDFLPKSLPQLGRVHFHTLFRPAGYVSGDLYDVMRLDETHVGFYIADAVGHGIPAALLTMFIKNALVTKEITAGKYRLLRPGETMAKLNDTLIGQKLSHATFATALYGTIDTSTLRVSFAAGGHPSPVLIRRDGTLIDAHAEGSLLGIFDNEQFADAGVQLESGDKLFIYTDGVEVAFPAGQTTDTHRWREELYNRRHLPAAELLRELSEQIDRSSGSLLPKDDLTVIVIEVE
jgi:phosphoserine phosphatase RsbU/P